MSFNQTIRTGAYLKAYLPYLEDINNANISFGASVLSYSEGTHPTR